MTQDFSSRIFVSLEKVDKPLDSYRRYDDRFRSFPELNRSNLFSVSISGGFRWFQWSLSCSRSMMCAARAPRSEGHLLTKVVMAQQFNLTEVLDAACHIMDSWDVAKLEGEIFRAVQRISRSNDADRK
jgi:hypothetical protein